MRAGPGAVVVAGAAAAVLTTGVVVAVHRPPAQVSTLVQDVAAPTDPSPSATPSPPALATPSPSPSPSEYALPEPPPPPTEGPRPVIISGTKTADISFFNHDPSYDVVIWVGNDRYGPFAPWQETGVIKHETHAGMFFRFVFPERHACDVAAAPLTAPLTGRWSLGVERMWHDPGCSGLEVFGSEPPIATRWSDRPTATPAPHATPRATPSPTRDPTPSTAPTATPEPTPTSTPSG